MDVAAKFESPQTVSWNTAPFPACLGFYMTVMAAAFRRFSSRVGLCAGLPRAAAISVVWLSF